MLILAKQFLDERPARRLAAKQVQENAKKIRDLEGDKLDQLEKEAGGVSAGRVTPHGGCH